MAARSSLQPVSTQRKRTPSGELPAARPDLSAMIAHDLKTPLSTIALNLEYVLDELGPDAPESLRSALEDCLTANGFAVRIVSEMAEAARLSRSEESPSAFVVDAAELVRQVVDLVGPEARSTGVVLSHSEVPSPSRAVPDVTVRALERLLGWAMRHARSGGSIDVELANLVIAVRVRTSGRCAPVSPDTARNALAVYFAQSLLASQGGGLWCAAEEDGALLVSIALPE